MMVTDERFQQHEVFGELDRYVEFYESLATSVFQWTSQGTSALANIDTYVYSSIQGTLSSINLILRAGRINDAYALLRKYYDSSIINIYSNLYLDDHFSTDNFIVTQIDGWLKGKSQLPEYRVMSQYVRNSAKVAPITNVISSDDRYRGIRSRCNDHAHYNFYLNVLLNDGEIFLRNRLQVLEQFNCDLRDIFVLHVAYLFFARQHYMMSSDYRDAIECNMTPEKGSEYWVAPFVQNIFDCPVKSHRPDIATIIKDHTSMELV